MLINPSPTTVLALWLSGCAAGGAGSGRQGRDPLPATHPLPAHSCPAQVLQRCPTMVTLSRTHGHAPGPRLVPKAACPTAAMALLLHGRG